MYKFAICGRAGSGKNTIGDMIIKEFSDKYAYKHRQIAFADPVKDIARIMFPHAPERYWTGASEYRNSFIDHAFKHNQPLTARQLLIDIGSNLGRGYDSNIWINVLDYRLSTYSKDEVLVLTDCRFINEHNFLKSKGFTLIKVQRPSCSKIEHVSETELERIPNYQFDYIIDNNGSLSDLHKNVINMLNSVISKKT